MELVVAFVANQKMEYFGRIFPPFFSSLSLRNGGSILYAVYEFYEDGFSVNTDQKWKRKGERK